MTALAEAAQTAPPRFMLRRAGPQDAALLSSIKIACWRESYADNLPAALLAGLEKHPLHSPAAWRAVLGADGPQRLTYVVEAPRPVGLLRFGPYEGALPGPRGIIDSLYLRRSVQERGIGTRLLSAARAWLAGAGLAPVAIGAFTFNDRALALYSRLGAVPLGMDVAFAYGGKTIQEQIFGWP